MKKLSFSAASSAAMMLVFLTLPISTVDLCGVWGLAYVAGPAHGDYALQIDAVSIR